MTVLNMSTACRVWATRYKRKYGARKISTVTAARAVIDYANSDGLYALDFILQQHFPKKKIGTIFDLVDSIYDVDITDRKKLLNKILAGKVK